MQSICRRYLSEEDYRVIWQVRDRDTFLKQIRQGAWTFTLDQQLTHILDALQKFVNLTVAGSHYEEAQTSIIWSILLLLVQVRKVHAFPQQQLISTRLPNKRRHY